MGTSKTMSLQRRKTKKNMIDLLLKQIFIRYFIVSFNFNYFVFIYCFILKPKEKDHKAGNILNKRLK